MLISRLKKIMRLWIIHVTGDFNWLVCVNLKQKLSGKQSKMMKHLRHQKILFFLCACIKWTRLLYSLQKHG